MEIGKDVDFQKSLLVSFLKGNKTKFSEIKNALETGDIKLAHRLAHTLKGNAGLIGKVSLQKAAAAVETCLENEINRVEEKHLIALENELTAVILKIEEEFPVLQDEIAEFTVLDKDCIKKLFNILESMLEVGNPDSCKFITELQKISGSKELIQQIDDYDFELAAVTLEKLKNELEIN
jgi:HPt (histidine-containing phosphotransfer) domain-containing protein